MRRLHRGRLAAPWLALACALALAGCAGRRAEPPPPAPPAAPPEAAPAPAPGRPPEVIDSLPRTPGTVTAPWDTAARSREVRRAHIYPQGESALGRRLVDDLPDPGGLPPAEGPPVNGGTGTAPTPAPTSGPCWEAQLVVTSDGARAERVRAEASALLGVPVRVASTGGSHRVRAGGCLDADAALRLAERARGEGWPEAFRTEAAR